MELANRVALVMGASRGIGKAIALTLAREGADEAINANQENIVQTILKKTKNLGLR